MLKIVYFSVDLHGHVNPSLGLISRLTERGEKVFYYSNDPFQKKIEETGAVFCSYGNAIEFGPSDAEGIDGFFLNADYILGKTEIMMRDFYKEVEALKPDLIIHDAFCLWGRTMAEKLGIPGVSLFAHFAYIHEMVERDPEFFMEYVVKAADFPAYKTAPALVTKKILNKATRQLSAKYGIENLNLMNDVFGSKENLNIVFSSRDFQVYSDCFDESYHFAGYTPFPKREAVPFPFEELNGKPLVYIAFGTILQELNGVIDNCLKALKGVDCQVVLSTGKNFDTSALSELPPGTIVREYVPQLDILEKASLFITHGGANSIYESLCYEVPMVVLPQVFDEFVGGIMTHESSTGINLKKPCPEVSEIHEAVVKVLEDPAYKEACICIRESFDRTGGLDSLVEKICAGVPSGTVGVKA